MSVNRKRRCITGFVLLTAALLAMLFVNLISGSAALTPGQALSFLVHPGAEAESAAYRIVWEIRLPRLLTAAILGGMLSISGFLLQTFFANPIAGPFVLGISSGAKLVVALLLIFMLKAGRTVGSAGLVLAAFAGSLLSMGFILLIAGRVKQASTLVICGVMIGYICSAVTEIVISFADDSNIVNLHNWSMGSFSASGWGNVRAAAVIAVFAMLGAMLLSKPMEAYQLGETYAASMGVNVPRFRVRLILLSSLLSACVTAFAGPISFVGIAVPHLVKRLFGTAKPLLILPAAFLGGAFFCLLCDLIARTMFAPAELSISSVTAVFGAPVVIWILLHRQKGR